MISPTVCYYCFIDFGYFHLKFASNGKTIWTTNCDIYFIYRDGIRNCEHKFRKVAIWEGILKAILWGFFLAKCYCVCLFWGFSYQIVFNCASLSHLTGSSVNVVLGSDLRTYEQILDFGHWGRMSSYQRPRTILRGEFRCCLNLNLANA